jgi:hypothetical protein
MVWTEAAKVPAERLAASLPHAPYGIVARWAGEVLVMGLILC